MGIFSPNTLKDIETIMTASKLTDSKTLFTEQQNAQDLRNHVFRTWKTDVIKINSNHTQHFQHQSLIWKRLQSIYMYLLVIPSKTTIYQRSERIPNSCAITSTQTKLNAFGVIKEFTWRNRMFYLDLSSVSQTLLKDSLITPTGLIPKIMGFKRSVDPTYTPLNEDDIIDFGQLPERPMIIDNYIQAKIKRFYAETTAFRPVVR